MTALTDLPDTPDRIADYFETCEPAYPWGERWRLYWQTRQHMRELLISRKFGVHIATGRAAQPTERPSP